MSRRAVILLTLQLAFLSAAPLGAQENILGADFWAGVGRFGLRDVSEVLDPPDLSGTYQLDGKNPGDSGGTYQTTLTVKRKKTVETPQGRKVNWYEIRYDFTEPVHGVAVHIGHRLYWAYGSKNIALVVGAPLILTPDEEAVARRARAVQLQAAEANENYDDNSTYFSKGAPWFSAVKIDKRDHFHVPSDVEWRASAFYALWFSARGSYGLQVFRDMASWGEGAQIYIEYDLKKGNEAGAWGVGRLTIAPDQATFQVEENATYPNEYSVNGTAYRLEDGTVVWVIGGGETAGAGYYDIGNGALSGPWWVWGGSLTGTETLTPPEAVKAKYPDVFAGR